MNECQKLNDSAILNDMINKLKYVFDDQIRFVLDNYATICFIFYILRILLEITKKKILNS